MFSCFHRRRVHHNANYVAYAQITSLTRKCPAVRTLFKNVIHGALPFCDGVSKSTFPKYSSGREGGRGSQKGYSVYALDNVDHVMVPTLAISDGLSSPSRDLRAFFSCAIFSCMICSASWCCLCSWIRVERLEHGRIDRLDTLARYPPIEGKLINSVFALVFLLFFAYKNLLGRTTEMRTHERKE